VYSFLQIAKSLPRICFLSGLGGEEMIMFIDAFPETGNGIFLYLNRKSVNFSFGSARESLWRILTLPEGLPEILKFLFYFLFFDDLKFRSSRNSRNFTMERMTDVSFNTKAC
jgi:hypothetical protein